MFSVWVQVIADGTQGLPDDPQRPEFWRLLHDVWEFVHWTLFYGTRFARPLV